MPSVPRVVEIARIVELVRKGEPMRRRLLSGLGVFTIACVAAGCGSSNGGLPSNGVASKSPIQILHAAVGAMKSAKSVYIAGSQTTAGKTVGIDATIFSNGDIDGSVTEDASNIGVVKIGGTDYIKATGAFYKADGATAKIAGLMGGKWGQAPRLPSRIRQPVLARRFGELDPIAQRNYEGRQHLDAQRRAGGVDCGVKWRSSLHRDHRPPPTRSKRPIPAKKSVGPSRSHSGTRGSLQLLLLARELRKASGSADPVVRRD
jgi:hypothetical protein